mgnify:CR=1 FL=1
MDQSKKERPSDPVVPPVWVVNTALRLRRFLLRAADAVVPPYVALIDRFFGASTTMLMHSAASLRIADHLAEGPLDAATLASRTGASPDELTRTMRVLVAVGVFRALPGGRFANNRASTALIADTPANVRGFVEFFGQEPVVRAWLGLPTTLRERGVAFDRANGQSVWDWLTDDAKARAAFVEGMSSMTEVIAPAIAAAYPFGEVKTVCDVGGGVGIVLAAVLRKHPHLRGVLFDSPAMLGEAGAHLERNGVASRVELSPGSFFEKVPRGADAYLLKTVLHNWDDARAAEILRNCRAAMDPGHRLIVEDFLHEDDAINTLVPYMDLAGMLLFSGRERDPEAMGKLFHETGFRLGRVIPLPGGQALFEGVAVA